MRAAAKRRVRIGGSPNCGRRCSSKSILRMRLRAAIKNGSWVHVWGPEMQSGKVTRMKALVTERIGKGVAWMPYHFAGWFQGVDQRAKYPKGADPIVLGESNNTITTYGYDPVTGMQEPKATLCQIRAA